jgi:hypothetical protein
MITFDSYTMNLFNLHFQVFLKSEISLLLSLWMYIYIFQQCKISGSLDIYFVIPYLSSSLSSLSSNYPFPLQIMTTSQMCLCYLISFFALSVLLFTASQVTLKCSI